MRMNRRPPATPEYTHEGATASRMTPIEALTRSVMSCFLFEGTFYEDGQSIAERIDRLSQQVIKDYQTGPQMVAMLAIEARNSGLRHVPLLLVTKLLKYAPPGFRLSDTIAEVIRRPDEMGELLALYMASNAPTPGKRPAIDYQLKRGLQKALQKFDSYYSLSKNDSRSAAFSLRDVIRIARPKPRDIVEGARFEKIAKRTLPIPATWETRLSSGEDAKAVWEDMLAKTLRREDGGLGYMALIRNLRNMVKVGVSDAPIRLAILARHGSRYVLPFRYVAAARAAPDFERELDKAMQDAVKSSDVQFLGKTAIIVDVSGSMNANLSGRSDMTRMDTACALAAVFPGDRDVFSFSTEFVKVPPRDGMALIDAIKSSQMIAGTALGRAIATFAGYAKRTAYDRVIIVTDEQSMDNPDWSLIGGIPHRYLINVANYRNGIGYAADGMVHIDGWSDRIFGFMAAYETPGGDVATLRDGSSLDEEEGE